MIWHDDESMKAVESPVAAGEQLFEKDSCAFVICEDGPALLGAACYEIDSCLPNSADDSIHSRLSRLRQLRARAAADNLYFSG